MFIERKYSMHDRTSEFATSFATIDDIFYPSETACGSHCGCPGNNETYDIVTLLVINSDVYSFNGEILKMNHLRHATETFVLRFSGGSCVISTMKQFYDACTTSRVDDSSSSLTVAIMCKWW